MLTTPAGRAVLLGLAIAVFLGLLHLLGVGLPILFWLCVFIAIVVLVAPTIARNWAGDVSRLVRGYFWAPEQGHFHSFMGVPLHTSEDRGRVWVDGDGVQRALGRREPEDVLAARFAGHWRRDAQGRLMLSVEAVVQHLAHFPRRNEHRVQRLRRYLERNALYPAAHRKTGANR